MAIRVNFNPAAVLANSNLINTDRLLSKSIERLSSGLRINRAADDPAGLTIGNTIRHDLVSLKQATNNTEDGVSMLQTAEGAMDEISAMLLRMRELAINAANTGANNQEQLDAMQSDLNQLVNSVDLIAQNTRYGSTPLLDGTLARNTLSDTAEEFFTAVTHRDERMPAGIQLGSTIAILPPSADLQHESISVTMLNGGLPAAGSDALNGLTQDGTALTVAGGEQLTIRGPDGNQTIDLLATTTVQDVVSIINSETNNTGVRANYDDTTGALMVESINFGSGPLHIETTDDLSGGANIGLLDTDTTGFDNPLEATRDTFSMSLVDPAGPAPALLTDTIQGLEGDGTLFDAVDGGQLFVYGKGEVTTIDLTASSTIQEVVNSINAGSSQTGALASYDAATGALEVIGNDGPIFLSSSDLTTAGSSTGLLDADTTLLDDTGGTHVAQSANVTADVQFTAEDGTVHIVTLTQVPGQDGGLTFTNLLPGPEMAPEFTGFEAGALNITMRDTTDGSMGSTVTSPTATLSATRRSPLEFQVGSRTGDIVTAEIRNMRAGALGHSANLAVDGLANLQDLVNERVFSLERAQEAISVIDAAIDEVSTARGAVGSVQSNALERTSASLRIAVENLTDAESRIRDVDFAIESAEYAKQNVRLQAATSMLGQANQVPQSILQLLQ